MMFLADFLRRKQRRPAPASPTSKADVVQPLPDEPPAPPAPPAPPELPTSDPWAGFADRLIASEHKRLVEEEQRRSDANMERLMGAIAAIEPEPLEKPKTPQERAEAGIGRFWLQKEQARAGTALRGKDGRFLASGRGTEG